MKRREMIQAIAGGLTSVGLASDCVPDAVGEESNPPLLFVLKTDRHLSPKEYSDVLRMMTELGKSDCCSGIPVVILPPGMSLECVLNPAIEPAI